MKLLNIDGTIVNLDNIVMLEPSSRPSCVGAKHVPIIYVVTENGKAYGIKLDGEFDAEEYAISIAKERLDEIV